MKVIIGGAGEVGSSIARYLAEEDNEVTIIDQDPQLVASISGSTDIRAVRGHAALPETLENVGVKDADIVIAVTPSDEVNMVICQMAHSLFNVPVKIARIREQGYLDQRWSDIFRSDHMPINHVISPETEVAHAFVERLRVPGAGDVFSLARGKAQLINLRLTNTCPVLKTPLKEISQLFPDLNVTIMAILRENQLIVPKTGQEELLVGDQIYFAVETIQLNRALSAFGYENEETPRILIVGGGKVGLRLAQNLANDIQHKVQVNIIEYDKKRAVEIASEVKGTSIRVYNGDALDSEILKEASAENSQAIVCVTNDDETNALACLLGKKLGIRNNLALINRAGYDTLLTNIGIDSVVMPRSITVSSILRHVRHGRIISAHAIAHDQGEVLEALALETSNIVGTPLRDLDLPKEIIIGAVIRNGAFIRPRGSTVINAEDHVILFATKKSIRKAERLFSVSLEWF
ncbi:MAG: Trk system potassium transporter TrkA [Alphaproteobacteria bacterium]